MQYSGACKSMLHILCLTWYQPQILIKKSSLCFIAVMKNLHTFNYRTKYHFRSTFISMQKPIEAVVGRSACQVSSQADDNYNRLKTKVREHKKKQSTVKYSFIFIFFLDCDNWMHYSGHWAQRCDVEYDGVNLPTFWDDALTLYGQRCKCSCSGIFYVHSHQQNFSQHQTFVDYRQLLLLQSRGHWNFSGTRIVKFTTIVVFLAFKENGPRNIL